MRRNRWVLLWAAVTAATPFAVAAAQRPAGMAGMGMGMGRGMMGMTGDSASMVLMTTSHALVINHELITRTVDTLANGVRTTTESDDPAIAKLIREHVATTVARVDARKDPGLPMESPALRTIFAKGAVIRTTTTATARGIVVVQTSDDPAAVAALKAHASEVTDLVVGGMAAMHAAMLKNGPAVGRPDTTKNVPRR